MTASHPCRALTVPEFRLALSDLDNVTVRIADVAARLAVLTLSIKISGKLIIGVPEAFAKVGSPAFR
jgi:hypothetical protein